MSGIESFGGGSSEPEHDYTAQAREYGEYLGLAQGDDESDNAFRHRVSGELRRQGRIIEAHEAQSGRRWDDPEQGHTGPMTGIIGAVTQALERIEYSPNDPVRQVGDDIAVGMIVQSGPDPRAEAIRSVFELLGPEDGMNLIESFYKSEPDQPRP